MCPPLPLPRGEGRNSYPLPNGGEDSGISAEEPMAEAEDTRRAGRIVVRKGLEGQTEDRRLLERQPAAVDPYEADPWRVLRIQAELVAGFEPVSQVGPD